MSNRMLSASLAGVPALSSHPRPPAQPRRRVRSLREATAELTHYVGNTLLSSRPLLFGAVVIGALYLAWHNRDEGHLTPESGLGYWLGVAGSVMMLTLLLYPLRKRMRALRFLGRVPSWFRLHMILGIVGPSLIVVHSNWQLASFNATVAMMSMLIVVASGVVGRYLYGKVHMGLYGRKAEVEQILTDAGLLKRVLGEGLSQTDEFLQELRVFENRILTRRHGFLSQTAAFLTLGIRRALLWARLMRLARRTIAAEGKRRGWSRSARRRRRDLVRNHLRLYFAALTKAARFGVYERLLALWHVLHLPLFFLLISAAIIHVIAVHLY